MQALPKTKLLGYYSDAYKLEFIAPKFNMYRRILADVLSEEVIRGRGWPMERALELAKLILIDNPKRIFAEVRAAFRAGDLTWGRSQGIFRWNGASPSTVAVRGPAQGGPESGSRFEDLNQAARGISRHEPRNRRPFASRRFSRRASCWGWLPRPSAQMTQGPGLSSGSGAGTGSGYSTGVQRNRSGSLSGVGPGSGRRRPPRPSDPASGRTQACRR